MTCKYATLTIPYIPVIMKTAKYRESCRTQCLPSLYLVHCYNSVPSRDGVEHGESRESSKPEAPSPRTSTTTHSTHQGASVFISRRSSVSERHSDWIGMPPQSRDSARKCKTRNSLQFLSIMKQIHVEIDQRILYSILSNEVMQLGMKRWTRNMQDGMLGRMIRRRGAIPEIREAPRNRWGWMQSSTWDSSHRECSRKRDVAIPRVQMISLPESRTGDHTGFRQWSLGS
jgi:hypothetical protein